MLTAEVEQLIDETFVRGVTFFDETDSTNTQASKLLEAGEAVEFPHLVYCERQTAGRGRGGNDWWSAPGSLTFSVIVDCQQAGIGVDDQSKLSLAMALAMLRTGVHSIGQAEHFSLKWPNDVFLCGRKLAGILIEAPATTDKTSIRPVVIGIGLNVNNSFADAPPAIEQTGTSLFDVTGNRLDRLEVLKVFLKRAEIEIQSLAAGDSIVSAWAPHCLLTGTRVTIAQGPNRVTGICTGIDESGALILKNDSGTQKMLGGVVTSWA